MTTKKQPKRFWSIQEDERLERLWLNDLPTTQIACEMGRTYQAITSRRNFLGLPSKNVKQWDDKQDLKFARLYVGTRLPMQEVSAIMGRSLSALASRSYLLDLPSRKDCWKDPDLIMRIFNIPHPEVA